MTDNTKFGHDQLGHILADYLLKVPRFQRSYSWTEVNVREFLQDLEKARSRNVDYFMGTVVFARPGSDQRRQIVDGQQRLATTAILYIAIRDELRRLNRDRQADELEKRFLRGYVISADTELERLILNGDDVEHYSELLDSLHTSENALQAAYRVCVEHLRASIHPDDSWEMLIEISEQVEKRVQVLVAEATDLPEAYVIFETLNDRGADLTTADLLKNFLFSTAGDYFDYVEGKWLQLEGAFGKPEELVKFIRFDFSSHMGAVPTRRLYRSIQETVGDSSAKAKKYINRLIDAERIYSALRDPEDDYWNDSQITVKDGLYAYRRFGFEGSFPTLMAAFREWDRKHADALLAKMAKWSVRAQVVGNLGGGTAEEVFSATAAAVANGSAHNQTQVRELMDRIIPDDAEFSEAFASYVNSSTARAKYLLAMLDKVAKDAAGISTASPDWHSPSVTVEHILPISQAKSNTKDASFVARIGNLALLERKLNKGMGSKEFLLKRESYRHSAFLQTSQLGRKQTWTHQSITSRSKELAELAVEAWPID